MASQSERASRHPSGKDAPIVKLTNLICRHCYHPVDLPTPPDRAPALSRVIVNPGGAQTQPSERLQRCTPSRTSKAVDRQEDLCRQDVKTKLLDKGILAPIKEQRLGMESFTATPSIVDLFCGCGGFSLGAKLAGFHTLAAIDIDPILQSGYRKNFPSTKAVEANVADIAVNDWHMIIGHQRPHGIIGGPPCQGFSRIGKREKEDPRNDLVHHFYRHVRELRPKFFVMENVQGILDDENLDILTNGIEQVSAQYNILGPFVVNAVDYGAPTNRYRVLVIGYDPSEISELSINDFSSRKIEKNITVKDAIFDLSSPVEDTKSGKSFVWGKYRRLKKESISAYALEMRRPPPPGIGWPEALSQLAKGYVSGMAETKHSDEISERYLNVAGGKVDPTSKSYKLQWNGQCPTLRAGTGSDKGSFQAVRPLHPAEGRVITVREAARLQGFPDWYVFHPAKWHSFRMIGNSVSPIVSHGVLSKIMSAMTAGMSAEVA